MKKNSSIEPTDRQYIENCFSIVDKNSNRVPFKYNNIQSLVEQKMGQRTIIVKSRKLGCSSLIGAKFAVPCIWKDNTKAVVISHEKKATQRLLERVYYYINNLPLKPKLERESAEEIKFIETNSTYWIGTAGSKAFGRGDDITHLHISELDWWENPEMLTGLLEAVVPNGIVVIETTGNGYGSKTHTMWQRAEREESNFVPVFIPWFQASEYQICVPKGFELTKEEKVLKARYNLSNEQIAWRRDKIMSMDVPELFPQEYPSNLQEAFFSMQTSVFIPIEDVVRAINNEQFDKTSIKKITVSDVADAGDDESVIYDFENTKVVNKEIYRHKDLMDTTGRVLAHAIKNGSNMAGIDIVGEGKGVFDRLNEIHPPGIDIYPFDSREQAEDPITYFNKKAEAWHRAGKKFRDNRCDIPNDNILIEQLSGVTYIMKSNGKIAVSPRKDILKRLGHSPDRATTYIMGLYMLDYATPVKKVDAYAEDIESDYPFNPATV